MYLLAVLKINLKELKVTPERKGHVNEDSVPVAVVKAPRYSFKVQCFAPIMVALKRR